MNIRKGRDIMKIYCNTDDLSAAVNIVSKAVSSKSSIPYLEGVLLEAECDRLYLTGNDLEICIKTSIPCNVADEGKIVKFENYEFKIMSIGERRIERVKIYIRDRAEEEAQEENEEK